MLARLIGIAIINRNMDVEDLKEKNYRALFDEEVNYEVEKKAKRNVDKKIKINLDKKVKGWLLYSIEKYALVSICIRLLGVGIIVIELKEFLLLEFFFISCGILIVLLNIAIMDEDNFTYDDILPILVLEEIIDDYIFFKELQVILLFIVEYFTVSVISEIIEIEEVDVEEDVSMILNNDNLCTIIALGALFVKFDAMLNKLQVDNRSSKWVTNRDNNVVY